ncbi:MAG: protein kinase [Deltaproteobacteria bacterium]|nr:protein kinase [Deltaproteobacteria bacterium]MBW2536571.1 protein kinase [Deltaproteobacteria bacterium]
MSSWRSALTQGGGKKARQPVREEIQPGMQVTPNVRTVERLGEGAMGEVWVADHLTLKTQVAVKFISEELDPNDGEVLARFEREASTAARIKSPFVVQTFDQGVTPQGTPYIVMELLEGEGLGDRLDRTEWLSLQQAGQVLAHTAKALGSAHKLGIVHRDIKPDNVFLLNTDDGFMVKVLDFGIAKEPKLSEVGGLTQPGNLVGTPEFMSPDRILSPLVTDFRTDLWALAVTMYICVTGELPFEGNSIDKLCVEILSSKFTPPSQLRPDVVPQGIDAWFAKALARKPEERFGSAKEMALAFLRALPSGSELLEDELMMTGQNVGREVATRPATAIGIGGAQTVPQAPLAAEPASIADPATADTGKSSTAITLPQFAPPARGNRQRAILPAVAVGASLGAIALLVLMVQAVPEPSAPAAEPTTAETAPSKPSAAAHTTAAEAPPEPTAAASDTAPSSTVEPAAEPTATASSSAPSAAAPTTKPTPHRPIRPPRPPRTSGTPLPDPGF